MREPGPSQLLRSPHLAEDRANRGGRRLGFPASPDAIGYPNGPDNIDFHQSEDNGFPMPPEDEEVNDFGFADEEFFGLD